MLSVNWKHFERAWQVLGHLKSCHLGKTIFGKIFKKTNFCFLYLRSCAFPQPVEIQSPNKVLVLIVSDLCGGHGPEDYTFTHEKLRKTVRFASCMWASGVEKLSTVLGYFCGRMIQSIVEHLIGPCECRNHKRYNPATQILISICQSLKLNCSYP